MRNEGRWNKFPSLLVGTYFAYLNNSAYAWYATPFCTYPTCIDFLYHVTDSWLEKNLYRDPTTAAGRGFVNTSPNSTNTILDIVKGTSPPTSWTGFNMPVSFYASTKPSWWCNETPWPAIGANVDNFGGTLEKLPAQRRFEGLPCTASGGGSQALGVPGRPVLVP
jgi:hypothetical protein